MVHTRYFYMCLISIHGVPVRSLLTDPVSVPGDFPAQYHFVRDCQADHIVTVDYYNTLDMPADLLTKPLPKPILKRLCPLLLGSWTI